MSYGREANCGSSFLVESARMEAKAAIAKRLTQASVPPATTMSALLFLIISNAPAIASALVAQAETGE